MKIGLLACVKYLSCILGAGLENTCFLACFVLIKLENKRSVWKRTTEVWCRECQGLLPILGIQKSLPFPRFRPSPGELEWDCLTI